jgi:hypothetical protein
MDDRCTAQHKAITLSSGNNSGTLSSSSQKFSLILTEKLCFIYAISPFVTFFSENNSHKSSGTGNYIKEASPLFKALFIVSIKC